MSIIEKIITANSEDEIDDIVKKRLEDLKSDCKKDLTLGFLEQTESGEPFKGFIHPSTRIKYSTDTQETYSMETEDYFFEFAHAIKEYNFDTVSKVINNIVWFINKYFGFNESDADLRNMAFYEVAHKTTTTDEEFLKKICNNRIGDLKGKGVAMSTEKAAIVQNLLSFVGITAFYVMGSISLNGQVTPHCFNVIETENGHLILDYSHPVPLTLKKFTINYLPFQHRMSEEEGREFLHANKILTARNYKIVAEDYNFEKVFTEGNRKYASHRFTFDFIEKPEEKNRKPKF